MSRSASSKGKRAVKTVLIVLLCIVLLLVAVVGGYVAYVFIAYHRIGSRTEEIFAGDTSAAKTGQEYSIVSWNVGFGAYSKDYSFFMDGGTESRAYSKEEVHKNIGGAGDLLKTLDPDFVILQEVDTNSTRSYHVDESALFREKLAGYNGSFCMNYDSPYLFYPILEPHGKSVAGLLSLSKCTFSKSERVELPVESGFMKLLDLDRCYARTEVPLENGHSLMLYNIHLSAYTSDGTIATEQLHLLFEDMKGETERGNYVVCGGDFNKDLLGDSSEVFGVPSPGATWALPFPEADMPAGFSLSAGKGAEDPVPSCRNCDIGYEEGKTFVLTVDGFLTSSNVTVKHFEVVNAGFEFSDHNPVRMTFELNPSA